MADVNRHDDANRIDVDTEDDDDTDVDLLMMTKMLVIMISTLFSDYPDSPEMDIAFAINTAASDADRTFQVITDSLKKIVKKFNPEKLRYSVITFGDEATPEVSFTEDPQDLKKLVKALDKLPQSSGDPDFKKLLDEAKKVFDDDSGRAKSNRVLVVITDSKSPATLSEINDAVKPLKKDGITVVAVRIGEEADSRQLEKMTGDKTNVLNLTKERDPEEIGNEVMKAVKEGWCCVFLQ